MNKIIKLSEFEFDNLIFRSLVPKGFRPQSDNEIELMLDGLGNEILPEEKLKRMLGKIQGDLPMDWESENTASPSCFSDSSENLELAEMFRSKGEELSPELEEKLREMEKRAKEPPEEEEGTDAK